MVQRILVPTDGSGVASQAADAAIEFAKACDAEIVALSIAYPEPVLLTAEGAIGSGVESQVDVLLEQAQSHVDRVAEAAAGAGVPCRTLTGYAYSPADEIVEAAERQHCDLIFIASHGRRGLSRLIAGSVTQRVLACASVPVMVFRPRPAQPDSAPPQGTASGRAQACCTPASARST